MADRLSPLSYDSGLHSISAPSSPKKLFEGTTAAEDEAPPAKRPKKDDDARVPASTESSEETLSSDDPPLPAKEQCQSFCSSMPSTSRLEQPLLITTAVEKSRGSLSPRFSLPSPEKKESRPGSRVEKPKEDERQEEKETEHVQTRERKSYIQEKPTCAWDECTIVFDDINILYDHVMETHIMPIVNREEEQDGELECLWSDCEMSIVRGDWTKKTRWLKEHYKARHAKGAQAVKCVIDQCTFRCTTFGKLDDHVRKVHLETKEGEQKGAKKTKEKAKKEDDSDSQAPYFPILQNEFPWNDYYVQIIVERQQRRREMNGQCEWVLKKRPGKGAAHRKARAPLVGEFVPKRPKTKPALCTPDPEIKERMKLTLEDLFPGWNYKSPFTTSPAKTSPAPKSTPPCEKAPNSSPPSPSKSEESVSVVRSPIDFLLPRLSPSSSSPSSIDSPASLPDPQIELDCSKCVDQLVTSIC